MIKANWFIRTDNSDIGPITEDQLIEGLLVNRWGQAKVRSENGKWQESYRLRKRFVELAGTGWYMRKASSTIGPLTQKAIQSLLKDDRYHDSEFRLGHDGEWRELNSIKTWQIPTSKRSTPNELPGKTLVGKVPCPHCWFEFSPSNVRWIASHSELRGDPKLGREALRRFSATRFNEAGDALDAKGQVCTKLACPRCHLEIPGPMLEMPPAFISVLGAPGSGKSYFLAAAVNALRNRLARDANIRWLEAAAGMNTVLGNYLQLLFANDNPEQLVALPKTEMEGELYRSIHLDNRDVWLPKPFPFAVSPNKNHVGFDDRRRISRTICLYDNAGEHFLPGYVNVDSFATNHLARSAVLVFLYDPTQHTQFRQELKRVSDDPQLQSSGRSFRQSSVLQEVVDRVRAHRGLAGTDPLGIPLVIVATKYDVWKAAAPNINLRENDLILSTPSGIGLNERLLEEVSGQTEAMINQFDPELAMVAESASDHLVYLPTSSIGVSPTFDEATQQLCVRPSELNPQWPDAALLYALNRIAPSLLPGGKVKRSR